MVRLNYLVLITILFTPISSLASNDVGYKYYERGNFKKALEIWSIEAKNGNGEAFYNMGLLYYFGNGVKKDLSIAYRYCKKAAFKGLPRAQNNLAFMYTKGRGIKKLYTRI